MPIDISLYPKNWDEISLRVKRRYNWTCQYCLKKPTKRNPLTTHHVDHEPGNLDEDYLKPLHASCHLLFHSIFRKCITLKEFNLICRNYQSQTRFGFIKEFEDKEDRRGFIRMKILNNWRKNKCLRSSSVESC